MSPFENHEEPWLRDALGSLLVDEPPMSPVAVVDDVRRGAVAAAVVKRRRTVSLAVAATILAVAVPVGLVLRAAPNASVTPPASSQSPTPGTTFTPPSLDAALVNTGWQVVGQAQSLNSSPSWAYLLEPSDGSAVESANVMVFAAQQTGPGPYLASCTNVTCPGDRSVTIADGVTATSGYRETSTVAGEGLIVPKGSLIVDKEYGTGTLVEVVVTSPWNNARDVRTPVTATSVLTLEQTRAILQVVGDPFSPSASPSSTSGVRFVPNADWPAAVAAALPGTATALDGAGVTSDGTSAVVNLRLERDGVGTFVRVRIDTPSQGYSSPLDADPCADTNGAATCTVLMPWETATVAGTPLASSVIGVTYPEGSGGSQTYSGAYSTRTVVLVRGQTVLTILSDSRDVDANGAWTSSTSPALAIDELLPLARALPLPYALQPAAEGPLWRSSSDAASSPVATAGAEQSAAQTAYAVAHPCRAADLSVTLTKDGATGTTLFTYAFRNSSAQACGLEGYPRLAGPGGAALPLGVTYGVRQNSVDTILPVRALLLPPGAVVTSLVSKYRCDAGVRSTVAGLVARVPGDSSLIALPGSAQQVCNGGATDPGNDIQVSAFSLAAG